MMIRIPCFKAAVLLLLGVGLVLSCSAEAPPGDNCLAGTEGCACYDNEGCDEGLSCLSGICVDAAGLGNTGGALDNDSDREASTGGLDLGGNDGEGNSMGGVLSVGGADASSGGSGSAGDSSGGRASGGMGGASGGAPGACDAGEQTVSPVRHSVYILLDRSSSMFEGSGDWEALKAATLGAVESLEAQLRFGMGTVYGTSLACTGLEHRVNLSFKQASAISAEYEALEAPDSVVHGPLPLALTRLTERLSSEKGKSSVLLLTDGGADFCDDGAPACGLDATVAALQLAHAAGITTIIAGYDSGQLDSQLLSLLAQAGGGEQPNWEDGLDVGPFAGHVDSICASAAEPWQSLRESNGNAPDLLMCGPNQPTAGNSDCHLPAGAYSGKEGRVVAIVEDTIEELQMELRSRLASLRGCEFELSLPLSEEAADQTRVTWGGIELDSKDWQRIDATHIRLLGEACKDYPADDKLVVDTACELIDSD